ncbi:tetraspanin Pls1 family [Lactifluus volemus]|nr:tetraspanin Pls1 family [Lactifluus volemus]
MVSKYLHGFYGFFTLSLAIFGILSITFSTVWKKNDILLNMTFSVGDLDFGLVMGIALLLTSCLSVGAIVQRNHILSGFVILNWRAEFHTLYANLQPSQRVTIQDMFSCCGYFNSTDLIVIGGNFCQNQTFANALNTTVLNNFCVSPITHFADVSLNDAFSTTYGFIAGIIGLFLSSLCVIKVRQEIERFKRIDVKRGGGGFV